MRHSNEDISLSTVDFVQKHTKDKLLGPHLSTARIREEERDARLLYWRITLANSLVMIHTRFVW